MNPGTRRQTLFIVAFLCVVLLFVTSFRMGIVRGDSMEPTYQNGQLVLVRRFNRFSAPLRHNDVILVRKDRDVIIKRVYRLSGEEITEAFPNLLAFTNYNHISDYYEQQIVNTKDGPVKHLRVPDGYIAILGDNLKVSEDSRIFGPVPIRDILGTVVRAPGPPYSAGPLTKSPDPAAVQHRSHPDVRP